MHQHNLRLGAKSVHYPNKQKKSATIPMQLGRYLSSARLANVNIMAERRLHTIVPSKIIMSYSAIRDEPHGHEYGS